MQGACLVGRYGGVGALVLLLDGKKKYHNFISQPTHTAHGSEHVLTLYPDVACEVPGRFPGTSGDAL